MAAGIAAACAPTDHAAAAAALEAAIPVLEDYRVEEMFFHDRTPASGDCAFIRYRAGWFASGDGCGPRGRGVREPLDAEVWEDIAAIQASVRGASGVLDKVWVLYGDDGSLEQGTFELDECRTFRYKPGYVELPEPGADAHAVALSDDWYVIVARPPFPGLGC